MTAGERIKNRRLDLGMKQIDLANAAGITKQLLYKYETGRITNIPLENIEKIAAALDIDPTVISGWADADEEMVTFPIIGDVAAHFTGEAQEIYDTDNISIPSEWLKGRPRSDYFIVRVNGDSMYPAYQDGDLVLVLRQSTLNHSGQVGVLIIDDKHGTLKKVEYVYGEDWMRLIPLNPQYPPELIENERLEHCRVLGIPKRLMRELP